MVGPLAIGIDVGTTGLKAVALDPSTGIVAQAHRAKQRAQPGVTVAVSQAEALAHELQVTDCGEVFRKHRFI